jgi:hypothetical protein
MMNVVFGSVFLLFGTATLVMRFAAPDSPMFSKLEPMQEQFGERAGLALHVLGYTVVPLIVGASMLAAGLLT